MRLRGAPRGRPPRVKLSGLNGQCSLKPLYFRRKAWSRDTRARGDGSATLSVAVAMVNIAVVRGWVLGGGEG
jgi:hypothetical protein